MISYMKEMSVKKIDEQIWEEEASIVVEHQVTVAINGVPAIRLVCSNDQIEELVIGHLYTQGYITRTDQIKKILIDELGKTTKVDLTCEYQMPQTMTMTTTGNLCCDADLPDRPGSGVMEWKKEWIFHLAELFGSGTELYQKTRGLHSCMLAREDRCLYFSEDIGRHNALDKVVGRALMEQQDLSNMILYSSGRIPADMMRKVVRSKVPLIVTKSVPTDDAISLADQYGITLIGKARPYGMILYTNQDPSHSISSFMSEHEKNPPPTTLKSTRVQA